MADLTNIEWCDSTFNPWVGCTKVSPACDHCYAEGWAKRSGSVQWGNAPRRRTSVHNWNEPLRWERKSAEFHQQHGRRRRVFCASLADVFDNQVPPSWRADLWTLIAQTPDLDWLLLTKRPQNIERMLPDDWGAGWPNVWLGTTVEIQSEADRRIRHLLDVPAQVHFLSCEPLLGPLDLTAVEMTRHPSHWAVASALDNAFFPKGIDWVIAGGESGHGARASHPGWFRSLRDQCAAAGTSFLFKQWGDWDEHGVRVGKKVAGRLLDGVSHDGMPEVKHD